MGFKKTGLKKPSSVNTVFCTTQSLGAQYYGFSFLFFLARKASKKVEEYKFLYGRKENGIVARSPVQLFLQASFYKRLKYLAFFFVGLSGQKRLFVNL